MKNDKKPEILDKNPHHGSCDTLFNAKRPPFPPKEEGADHVRLGFPLAGVARKTLHLKVAGIICLHSSLGYYILYRYTTVLQVVLST